MHLNFDFESLDFRSSNSLHSIYKYIEELVLGIQKFKCGFIKGLLLLLIDKVGDNFVCCD